MDRVRVVTVFETDLWQCQFSPVRLLWSTTMRTWPIIDTELSRGIAGRVTADETSCPFGSELTLALVDCILAVYVNSTSFVRVSWPSSGSMIVETDVTGKRLVLRSQSGWAFWREVHVRVIESVRACIVLPKEKKGIDSPSVLPC